MRGTRSQFQPTAHVNRFGTVQWSVIWYPSTSGSPRSVRTGCVKAVPQSTTADFLIPSEKSQLLYGTSGGGPLRHILPITGQTSVLLFVVDGVEQKVVKIGLSNFGTLLEKPHSANHFPQNIPTQLKSVKTPKVIVRRTCK